jgi:hypothetical protein
MREMVEGVDQDIREGTPLRRARQTRKRFGHVNGSTGESLDVDIKDARWGPRPSGARDWLPVSFWRASRA